MSNETIRKYKISTYLTVFFYSYMYVKMQTNDRKVLSFKMVSDLNIFTDFAVLTSRKNSYIHYLNY